MGWTGGTQVPVVTVEKMLHDSIPMFRDGLTLAEMPLSRGDDASIVPSFIEAMTHTYPMQYNPPWGPAYCIPPTDVLRQSSAILRQSSAG